VSWRDVSNHPPSGQANPLMAAVQACATLSSATVVQDDCSELVSLGQQAASVAHVPVGVPPPLLLPELEVLLPLLLPEPLLEVELHSLAQFAFSHEVRVEIALWQLDSCSWVMQEAAAVWL